MGVLYRTPEGLLDLTGQRVGGKYPQGLSDVVVPTLDLTHLLQGRLVSSETAASLTSNVGDTATLTVPDNEVWALFNVAIQYVPSGPGNIADFSVYLDRLPGSTDPVNKLYLADFDGGSGVDAAREETFAQHFSPIALSAGTRIVGIVTDESAVAQAWALHAGLYKLIGN